ncbi:MAG: hypothetical protein AAB426_09885, partial [Myxococcota bacterium]
ERRNVLDAIREDGGRPILAHPADVKRPWAGPVGGAAGLEVANLAASARRHRAHLFLDLLPLLIAAPLRPDLALAQLYDRDRRALSRWDEETDPRVVGLCGNDAHGWLDMGLNMSAWLTVLDEPLPPEQDARPQAIVAALTQGRSSCVAGMLGRAAGLTFVARAAGATVARAGESVEVTSVEALDVVVPAVIGARARLVLLRNGAELLETARSELHYVGPLSGTYRVEVRVPVPGLWWGESAVTAMYSNRIRILAARAETSP